MNRIIYLAALVPLAGVTSLHGQEFSPYCVAETVVAEATAEELETLATELERELARALNSNTNVNRELVIAYLNADNSFHVAFGNSCRCIATQTE